jgi:hypothetical protein
MEMDLSDRTNNVLVIKYFNLLLFFSTKNVWKFNKKSEIHTYCDSILIHTQKCTDKTLS